MEKNAFKVQGSRAERIYKACHQLFTAQASMLGILAEEIASASENENESGISENPQNAFVFEEKADAPPAVVKTDTAVPLPEETAQTGSEHTPDTSGSLDPETAPLFNVDMEDVDALRKTARESLTAYGKIFGFTKAKEMATKHGISTISSANLEQLQSFVTEPAFRTMYKTVFNKENNPS